MEHLFLFLSGGEIMVVVFFVLLFFGADAIPGLARTAARGMREFRKATDDIKREFDNHTSDFKKDFDNLADPVQKGTTTESKRKIDEELKD